MLPAELSDIESEIVISEKQIGVIVNINPSVTPLVVTGKASHVDFTFHFSWEVPLQYCV